MAPLRWPASKPSNERDWLTEYARLPTVEWGVQGKVTLRNVRNFTYRTRDDYSPDWYDAEYDLNQAATVDVIASYWSGKSIAHLFLSFGFQDGRHLAISIETRRSRGQFFSTWRGFFNYYMLTYVVADERDLIGVRTDVRREQVYLYPVQIAAPTVRQLLLEYLRRIDQLSQRPEFYHTLYNNCTSNILRHAAAVSPAIRYHWRVLVSGYADRYVYDLGLLNNDLPFEQLKQRSLIVRPPDAVIDADFSRQIRRSRA
ncbi:DUF4105 domain-containing protein [Serratia sp. AKBS12]|uniref:Lnb N-terminal periplasmic domain-containing protein n=1 Tax=Serratia sp. AKBS12 TaxID=2974597 RepID=UPI0021655AD6|nr:DUF4105 domain-containing protein [Serratia sp. AKBS12]MCS3408321.1 DUF4105 domain-containing protein [Serratia sp. AKBS12]HEI8864659.1 DUF4105 domain-containing protein [Serratia odorifera]